MTDKKNRQLAAGGAIETYHASGAVISHAHSYSNTYRTISQQLVLPGGKIGGVLFGDVLRKTVTRSKHFCYKHRAYGIDAAVLSQAIERGAVVCEVVEDTGTTWRVDLSTIQSDGVRDNLGYGWQVFLPLTHWRRADVETEPERGPVQLELFS